MAVKYIAFAKTQDGKVHETSGDRKAVLSFVRRVMNKGSVTIEIKPHP